MRIVIMTSGIRGIGSYSFNLYKQLKKHNHEVLFVSETKWMKEPIDNLLEADSVLLFGLAPLVRNMNHILKTIREFRPDVIHYQWPSGTFDFFFGKIQKLGVPILVTLHVAVASKRQMFDKVWWCHFGLFKRHLRKTGGVNSISQFVLRQLQSRTDLPASKSFLQYAGVDEQIFCPQERQKTDTLQLLFVGQIMPEKGIDVLIKAIRRLRKHRNVVLSIIGSGHMKESLMRATKDDDCIQWIGFMKNQKDIASHYAQADLTVLPTRWDEAFSLVPVESLACGTPVMATRKGGTPEIIIPGVTGILLHECDEDEIYDALLHVDKKNLEAMRQECREAVLLKYTLKTMAAGHEELYHTLIAAARDAARADAGK